MSQNRQPYALPAAPPSQRRCWANRASLRPRPSQQGAHCGDGLDPDWGSGTSQKRVFHFIRAQSHVYINPGAAAQQHCRAHPQPSSLGRTARCCWPSRRLNPGVREHGSDLPMGSRLLLVLMLLQAGEYHLPNAELSPSPSPCVLLSWDSPSSCCQLCLLHGRLLRGLWPSGEKKCRSPLFNCVAGHCASG